MKTCAQATPPVQAARMFMVPITLFSSARRGAAISELTTSRVSTTVSISAARTMHCKSEWRFETLTNSVRSSSSARGFAVDTDDRLDVLEALQRLGNRPPAGREPDHRARRWAHAASPAWPARGSAAGDATSRPRQDSLREHLVEVLLDPRADSCAGQRLDQRPCPRRPPRRRAPRCRLARGSGSWRNLAGGCRGRPEGAQPGKRRR